MNSRILVAGSFLAVALAATNAAAQTQRFSLELARKTVGLGAPEISPDGKTIAFTVTRANYTDNRNETELYAVDVTTGSVRPLTVERRPVSEPKWSPDGHTLAFLAPDSSDHEQVWLMPMSGGDARKATRSKTDVQHYSWRPDGAAVAYAAEDTAPRREGEAKHLNTMEVGDQDLFLKTPLRPQHAWIQALDGAEPKRLTSGDWSLELVLPPSSPPSHLSWSADGKEIAFARVPAPQTGRFDSVTVQVVNVATGAIRSLTGAERFENNPNWSPDGKSVLYAQPRDGRGDLGWLGEIYLSPASGGPGRSLTRALDRNIFSADWLADSKSVLVAANDKTSVGLWVQPLSGAARRIDVGDLVIGGAFGYQVSVSPKGAIAFVASTSTHPSELYVMDTRGSKPRQLTHFNDWAKDVMWGRMERMTWKNDGFDEDGVLLYPPQFDADAAYPLVLLIHGGPQSSSKTSFSSLAQILAAQGWIVYQPNYRGSDNLGNTYQAAITKDAGPGPGRDVMAGLAELRKRAYVQKAPAAVTGWSYGGYMTSWLIGNYPDDWSSAIAGAPVTDLMEEYNLSDGNVSWRYFMGGSPWTEDRADLYRAQSPITYVGRVKTPTLVMSLVEDFRVPPAQALTYYRALKDRGVETEYIAFPGRGHNPRDPMHSMERQRLWVDWVRKHMTHLP